MCITDGVKKDTQEWESNICVMISCLNSLISHISFLSSVLHCKHILHSLSLPKYICTEV